MWFSKSEAADAGERAQVLLFLFSESRIILADFLARLPVFNRGKWRNNRSVMPLDVSGCTRATMLELASALTEFKDSVNLFNFMRNGD